jgi:hypothetical protein
MGASKRTTASSAHLDGKPAESYAMLLCVHEAVIGELLVMLLMLLLVVVVH